MQLLENQFAYNWYSGESAHLSVVSEPSEGPLPVHNLWHLGTPGGVGGTGHVGLTLYWGATSLSSIEGRALSVGKDASADVFLTYGVAKESGYGVREGSNMLPYIDPFSRVPVRFSQWNITSGGNALGNGVDFGVFGGYSVTSIVE